MASNYSDHDTDNTGETMVLPITDTMAEAAEIVVRRLDALQYDRFFQNLVAIAAETLTDADYGIVDADPTDRLALAAPDDGDPEAGE